MQERAGLRHLVGALWGCWLIPVVACQSPGSQPIVGPDGSSMAHVHCGAQQGDCFRMAGELCPSGYEMKPVLSGSDGNFLVRCRVRSASTIAGACPAPGAVTPTAVPVGSTHPTGLMDPWPPAAEPAPAAYPWPSPESSAAARNKPSGSGDVDIGY